MSHGLHLNQILMSLQLLGLSLEQTLRQVRHLERTLREGGELVEEEEQEEHGLAAPLPGDSDLLGAVLPCRSCGSPVRQSVLGQLFDLDGGDHFQTCSLGRVCCTHEVKPKVRRSRKRAEE